MILGVWLSEKEFPRVHCNYSFSYIFFCVAANLLLLPIFPNATHVYGWGGMLTQQKNSNEFPQSQKDHVNFPATKPRLL